MDIKKIDSVILWRGNSPINDEPVVAIATGFKIKSRNPKTGDAIQIAFYPDNGDLPSVNVANRTDESVCGSCPHRKDTTGKRSCYVTPMGLNASYDKYLRGGHVEYNPFTMSSIFEGRYVRFGSYGDPVLLPLHIVEHITKLCSHWTGYTHQWRNNDFAPYMEYFQASCDNVADLLEAADRGYSTFSPLVPEEYELWDKHKKNVAANLAARFVLPCYGGTKTDCKKCGLCEGNSEAQRHIFVRAHGDNAVQKKVHYIRDRGRYGIYLLCSK